jgi:heme-degrading monooxygenase HmoA
VSKEKHVNDTYTCSIWTIPQGREEDFVSAFQQFADSASELGAAEGLILQDVDDPTRFIVIRRWVSAQAVQHWQQDSGRRQSAGAALAKLAPAATVAYQTRKVADLAADA